MNEIHDLETATYSQLSFDDFRKEVLADYRLACESREASILARKEVLTGKAKFGIFGDGKELPQIAMAKFFQKGDFRSGYYRDQTFAFAAGISTIEHFFSQLYGDPDQSHDPFSAGRQMNSHFATPNVDAQGNWKDLADIKNTLADMAPTAAQMPRSVGLALASKLFREVEQLKSLTGLSDHGNEVCFTTIGDASTSEGHFWEAVNAVAVLQVPLAIFIWDDGYGISVPSKYQTAKGSISEALEGFQKTDKSNGIDIYRVKGWDYAGLCEVFESGIRRIRETHVPAVFHVDELTQPLGHSTSGSHERYKSKERLQWEKDWDCNTQMRNWMLENALANEEEIGEIERQAKQTVLEAKKEAWYKYMAPIREKIVRFAVLARDLSQTEGADTALVQKVVSDIETQYEPMRRDVLVAAAKLIQSHSHLHAPSMEALHDWYRSEKAENTQIYNTNLYCSGEKSALNIPVIPSAYAPDAPLINGYEVLNRYFDQLFASHPRVFAFGEDVGLIGDVNQGFAGLQQKHGAQRIFDTGIRELTIIGEGIGMAYRGLRPIAEVQYLDYLLYCLQPLSDDVATMQYRTAGIQACPLIVRTRGHRLEGIWHSGSPMGMIINSLRGMYICVPRNMVQAAGMYNTLLKSNDPALVIESLNGYRLKEMLPSNLGEFTVPLGIPEVLTEGTDLTIVSYGSILRIAQDAISRLAGMGISCELIDVQTLLPFDIHQSIVKSLEKTNRIIFLDEDVPGGASAFMFQQVIELQKGYRWLDTAPRTLTAKDHRPAYGSDGDYFSKPNAEDIMEAVLDMMKE